VDIGAEPTLKVKNGDDLPLFARDQAVVRPFFMGKGVFQWD
jgi:hypothetical protein